MWPASTRARAARAVNCATADGHRDGRLDPHNVIAPS